MTYYDLKLKLQKYDFMYIKWKLITQVMWKQLLFTLLTTWWPLMTSNDKYLPQNWKLQNYNFMYIKWKLVTQAI